MRTSDDRLGELRTQLLPHVTRHVVSAKRISDESPADLRQRATQAFDRALEAACTFHLEHPEEDPDVHLAHLMQVFCEGAGIPHLACLPVIEEFVLKAEKTKPAE